jgi:hypothetical protein
MLAKMFLDCGRQKTPKMGLGQIYILETNQFGTTGIKEERKKRTIFSRTVQRTFYAMCKETSLKMGWTKLVRGNWTELVKWYLASTCAVNLEDIKILELYTYLPKLHTEDPPPPTVPVPQKLLLILITCIANLVDVSVS